MKKPRKNSPEWKIEQAADALYAKHFNYVQVDMMDLGKISNELRAIVGQPDVDAKAQEIVARYKKS